MSLPADHPENRKDVFLKLYLISCKICRNKICRIIVFIRINIFFLFSLDEMSEKYLYKIFQHPILAIFVLTKSWQRKIFFLAVINVQIQKSAEANVYGTLQNVATDILPECH